MTAPSSEATTKKCVLCGKPQDAAYRPFCSKRCADIDLGRWLKGSYSIPARPEGEMDNPAPPPEAPSNDD